MNVSVLLDKKGTEVFSIRADAAVSECIDLLNQKKIGALIVFSENKKLQGIVTERDILHNVIGFANTLSEVKVSQIMTPANSLITTKPSDLIGTAMSQMTNNRIRHLPVLEKDKVVGVVSIGDVVKALLDAATRENKEIKEFLFVSGKY